MPENFARTVRGTGPGILLAHGGGGGVLANFGPIIDDLARTHTVVGADYPGSGKTPRSVTPLDLDSVADELMTAATGLDRFTVLGYSLGTAVAVRVATRHPHRVNGLILTSGFTKPDRRILLAAGIWRDLLASGDRRLTAKFLTLIGTGRAALNALDESGLADAVDALAEFLPPGSPEQIDLVMAVDTRAELASITAPTLVVSTASDDLAPPEHSRQLAAGIPGAELVEIDAGHSIGAEAPGEWLAAIRRFLTKIG